MKITRIGWVGKNENPIIKRDCCTNLDIFNIFSCRGNKTHWGDKNWPPRKVRITVEDVEEK